MGCDIHVFLERNRTVNGVKSWVNIDHWKINPYYEGVQDGDEKKWEIVPFYDERDYSLFSLLAGVRNYGDNQPISEERGIPGDISDIIKDEYTHWGCDAHSSSYFTLKELMDYNESNPTMKRRGMLSRSQIVDLERGILPDTWCQGTNMEGYEFREWDDETNLSHFIDKIKSRVIDEYYLFYGDDEHIQSEVLKESENVRTVFWFDN